MTERLDDIVGEMRGGNGAFPAETYFVNVVRLREWADRILAAAALERAEHRRQAEQAIADEPELPGEMPDEMWAVLSSDRDAATEALRILVRQTKAGIRARMVKEG